MPQKILKQVVASLELKEGFVDNARRQVTPLVVDCVGLTREHLGDEQFEKEFRERDEWCQEHCIGQREIELLRQGGQLTGRRYRFEQASEAVHFKLRFETYL